MKKMIFALLTVALLLTGCASGETETEKDLEIPPAGEPEPQQSTETGTDLPEPRENISSYRAKELEIGGEMWGVLIEPRVLRGWDYEKMGREITDIILRVTLMDTVRDRFPRTGRRSFTKVTKGSATNSTLNNMSHTRSYLHSSQLAKM